MIAALAHVEGSCSNPKCRQELKRGQNVFFDNMLLDQVYCQRCGLNLRFHRKRAVGRGETPPVTFADVDRRLEER
jgi:hypothetical protein